MEKQPYIKIIREEKEYTFTKSEWNWAWRIMFTVGCITGIILTLFYQSII